MVNTDYIQLMLRMGKTVVGVDAWSRRGMCHQGKFEDMILITDEVLIAWTLDGHYNGWCDSYKNRFLKCDGTLRGRNRDNEEEDSSPMETDVDVDESVNKMEKFKQLASVDPDDWLNYRRPRCGSWFIKKSMDQGYTKKNGGTTDFGKLRWNEWGQKIAQRRMAKTSEDMETREKYFAFMEAFQTAWKDVYVGDRKKAFTSDDGVFVEKIAAFNGITFSV